MVRRAVLLAFLIAAAWAAPPAGAGEVLVTVPPLHSLVGQLLQGVAEPRLMFTEPGQLGAGALPADLRARVDAADMVVRVGPAFEPALDGALPKVRGAATRSLTLTETVPLMTPAHPTLVDRPAGDPDSRFWMDPRLAKAAIGRIGPGLVRVFPEHTERILDNEIALRARLTRLEDDMRAALETLPGVPLHVPESDVLYLAWRFNLNRTHCPAAARAADGFGLAPGPDLYFVLMERIVAALKRCQRDPAAVPIN
ncbi:MAG: zinc ABC transporter substrate-binding protein [Hyphomicrobiales bacterium]|nr:zinc ABC transporter substrate-binding protein [Hyphomicrobiales bacterium]MCP5373121.1 zinc ABC transporter substrate-binding protein [Hyphomicrobiales bacterium]